MLYKYKFYLLNILYPYIFIKYSYAYIQSYICMQPSRRFTKNRRVMFVAGNIQVELGWLFHLEKKKIQ